MKRFRLYYQLFILAVEVFVEGYKLLRKEKTNDVHFVVGYEVNKQENEQKLVNVLEFKRKDK